MNESIKIVDIVESGINKLRNEITNLNTEIDTLHNQITGYQENERLIASMFENKNKG